VIVDVVSCAIAGIDFIHAVGRLFLCKGFTAKMTGVKLAAHKRRALGASFRTLHRLPPGKSQKSILREQGLMRFRLLCPPDRQDSEASPASQHTRGLEVNDSKHPTSW
jgi:hypothetical protein